MVVLGNWLVPVRTYRQVEATCRISPTLVVHILGVKSIIGSMEKGLLYRYIDLFHCIMFRIGESYRCIKFQAYFHSKFGGYFGMTELMSK